jgi:hypothetical protein
MSQHRLYAFFLVLSKADFQRRTNRFLGRGRGGKSAQGRGFGAETPSLEVSYPSSRGWRHCYVDVSLVEHWWLYPFRSKVKSTRQASRQTRIPVKFLSGLRLPEVQVPTFSTFALELEISTHIMWTARDNCIFHQTRLKYTQTRIHGP